MTATSRAGLITLSTGRGAPRNPAFRARSRLESSGESNSCRCLVQFIRTRAHGSRPSRDCRGEDSVTRSRKLSVFQVGKIRDDGRTVVISGWGLGLCASGCACHRHPTAGHLSIAEDQAGGLLGPASYPEGGWGGWRPWEADELSAILRDFEAVASLEAQEPLAG